MENRLSKTQQHTSAFWIDANLAFVKRKAPAELEHPPSNSLRGLLLGSLFSPTKLSALPQISSMLTPTRHCWDTMPVKGAEMRLLEQQCHQCQPTVMPLWKRRALMPEMGPINSNAGKQVNIPLYISVLFCLCPPEL